jgi:hypothetical protein
MLAFVCWLLLLHCQSYAELRMAYHLCLDAAGPQHYQPSKPRRRTPAPGPSAQASEGGGAADSAQPGAAPSRSVTPSSSAAVLLQAGPSAGSAAPQPARGSTDVELGRLGPAPASSHSDLSLARPTPSAARLARISHGMYATPLLRTLAGGPAAAAAAGGAAATASAGGTGAGGAVGGAGPGAGEGEARGPGERGPLLSRLALVAPWLRHTTVSARERAALATAGDNLVALLSANRVRAWPCSNLG